MYRKRGYVCIDPLYPSPLTTLTLRICIRLMRSCFILIVRLSVCVCVCVYCMDSPKLFTWTKNGTFSMKHFTTIYTAGAYRNEFIPHHEIECYKFWNIVQSIRLELKFNELRKGTLIHTYEFTHTPPTVSATTIQTRLRHDRISTSSSFCVSVCVLNIRAGCFAVPHIYIYVDITHAITTPKHIMYIDVKMIVYEREEATNMNRMWLFIMCICVVCRRIAIYVYIVTVGHRSAEINVDISFIGIFFSSL